MNDKSLIENPGMMRRFCEFSTLADLDLHPQRLPDSCDPKVCSKLIRTAHGTISLGQLLMDCFNLKPVEMLQDFEPQHQVALETFGRLNRALELTAKSVMKPRIVLVIEREERHRIREFIGQDDFAFLNSSVPLLIGQSRLQVLANGLVPEAWGDVADCYRRTLSSVINGLWGRESQSFRKRVELKLENGLSVPPETPIDPSQSHTLAALAVRILSQMPLEERQRCFG